MCAGLRITNSITTEGSKVAVLGILLIGTLSVYRHTLSRLACPPIDCRAIACGVTRMAFFAEILGPTCKALPSAFYSDTTD